MKFGRERGVGVRSIKQYQQASKSGFDTSAASSHQSQSAVVFCYLFIFHGILCLFRTIFLLILSPYLFSFKPYILNYLLFKPYFLLTSLSLYIYIYVCVYKSLSLSIYIYTCMYIHYITLCIYMYVYSCICIITFLLLFPPTAAAALSARRAVINLNPRISVLFELVYIL